MEYPLFVKATPGAELLFTISYDRQRFDDAPVARMTGHLETLLGGVAAADSATTVRELEWLSASEREEIVYGWNETEVAVESELSIGAEIGARARELGHEVALVSGREEVS
jgi:non-ribosomal peptide synthetase component F